MGCHFVSSLKSGSCKQNQLRTHAGEYMNICFEQLNRRKKNFDLFGFDFFLSFTCSAFAQFQFVEGNVLCEFLWKLWQLVQFPFNNSTI